MAGKMSLPHVVDEFVTQQCIVREELTKILHTAGYDV